MQETAKGHSPSIPPPCAKLDRRLTQLCLHYGAISLSERNWIPTMQCSGKLNALIIGWQRAIPLWLSLDTAWTRGILVCPAEAKDDLIGESSKERELHWQESWQCKPISIKTPSFSSRPMLYGRLINSKACQWRAGKRNCHLIICQASSSEYPSM